MNLTKKKWGWKLFKGSISHTGEGTETQAEKINKEERMINASLLGFSQRFISSS